MAELDVVSTWYGTFVCRNGNVVDRYPVPTSRAALLERLRLRREGRTTPEEERAVAEHSSDRLRSPDRRLAPLGVACGPVPWPDLGPEMRSVDPAAYRVLLRERAEEDLARSWDPALPLPEAFRALQDLESVENVLGERLEGWASSDREPSGGPTGDRLQEARTRIETLLAELRAAHSSLEDAIDAAASTKAPNLSSVLGARLAAQLIAQAGGLDRLARLPASTLQVLGAERAFFEHLRRGAPPPRHGLIFLHPTLHGAPREQRGRLARALAGKAAIAARMDREAVGLRPELKESFERRVRELQARPGRGRRDRTAPRSRAPLDGASEDR